MIAQDAQASPVEFVPASQFTIDALTDAYNQTRVDYLVPMPMSPRRLADYVHDYDVSLDDSLVAVLGGELLGLCMLGIRSERGWITRLGVLPTARRHHVGQRLMEQCVGHARALGLRELSLEVIIGNEPAHALFMRLGFKESQKLLILRRPPSAPPAAPASHDPLATTITTTWLNEQQIQQRANARSDRPAWTNQSETLANVGRARGLRIVDYAARSSGWVSYEETPLQLKHVIIGPDTGDSDQPDSGNCPPANLLLQRLHSRFPMLDAIAENVPADAPYTPDFYAQGYIESFARTEMLLRL